MRHGLTTHVPLTSLNIDLAVKDLLVAEVIVTRTLPLDALLKGMNVLGLGELLRKYPHVVSKIFPSVQDAVVSADMFLHKVTLADEEVKNNELEEQAWKWFQRFVVESEVKKGKWEKMAGEKIAKKKLHYRYPVCPPILDKIFYTTCGRNYV